MHAVCSHLTDCSAILATVEGIFQREGIIAEEPVADTIRTSVENELSVRHSAENEFYRLVWEIIITWNATKPGMSPGPQTIRRAEVGITLHRKDTGSSACPVAISHLFYNHLLKSWRLDGKSSPPRHHIVAGKVISKETQDIAREILGLPNMSEQEACETLAHIAHTFVSEASSS